MKTRALLLILAIVLVAGCAQVPLELTKYVPVETNVISAETFPFLSDVKVYEVHNDKSFTISAGVYEYNNIISILLSIKNKTSKGLSPENYSISLADGRDLKEIKMLTRQDLINIRSKYTGGGSDAIQDKVIDATMTNAMKITNMPTKDKLAALITLGIDNYFSFRPIYAGESRQGLLCFIPSFKLEYPVTLSLRLRSKDLAFQFMPATK